MSYPAISGLLRQPVPQARLVDKVQRNFELRKVALGICGRDYGTPCAHENAPLTEHSPAFGQVTVCFRGQVASLAA